MKVNIHIHKGKHKGKKKGKKFARVLYVLEHILNKLDIMATKEEFAAAFAEINEATTNIANDIERLANHLASDLTKEEEAGILAEIKAHAERLKGVAAITPEEAVEPEPEPEPEPSEPEDSEGSEELPPLPEASEEE